MAQPAVHPLIERNSIHFRPLNAHLLHGVLWASTMLKTNASEERWHGHVVHFLAKAVLMGGVALNSAVSLTEAVAFSALALFAGALNSLTKKQFHCLQKATLICGAHSLHSAGLWLGQLALFFFSLRFYDTFLSYHLTRTVLDHAPYVASAITIYTFFSERVTGDASQASRRIGGVVADDGWDALRDLGQAIVRDRGAYVPVAGDQEVLRDQFFQFIEHSDWSRLRNDEEYRRDRIRAFLIDFNIGQAAEGVANGQEIIANFYSQEERTYQGFLKAKVKAAFHTLHQDQILHQYLESGVEALEGFYAHVTTPLANYAQWLEVLDELSCPAAFTNNALQPYNNRRQKLEQLKGQVDLLSVEQRQQVVEALLKVDNSPLNGDAQLQQIFNEVSELSGSLHQGKLLSVMKINPAAIANLISYENLFSGAWMEAAGEVGQPQAANA